MEIRQQSSGFGAALGKPDIGSFVILPCAQLFSYRGNGQNAQENHAADGKENPQSIGYSSLFLN
jgi:hypothetical protein